MSGRETPLHKDSSSEGASARPQPLVLPREAEIELVLPKRVSSPSLGRETIAPARTPLEAEYDRFKKAFSAVSEVLNAQKDQKAQEAGSELSNSIRLVEERLKSSDSLSPAEKLEILSKFTSELSELLSSSEKDIATRFELLTQKGASLVSEFSVKMTERELSALPEYQLIEQAGNKLRFRTGGFEVSCSVTSNGRLENLEFTSATAKAKVEQQESPKDLKLILTNFAEFSSRFSASYPDTNATVTVRNPELMDFVIPTENGSKTIVVSGRDILEVVPDPAREEALTQQLKAIEQEIATRTEEISKFKKDNGLEELVKKKFHFGHVTSDEIEYLSERGEITKEQAELLTQLQSKISERYQAKQTRTSLLADIARRELVGKDRLGRDVRVSEELALSADAEKRPFDRTYRDENGKIIAEYVYHTGCIATAYMGGPTLYHTSRLTEFKSDGSKTVTSLAANHSFTTEILELDRNNLPLSSSNFSFRTKKLDSRTDYQQKEIVTYRPDGTPIVKRIFTSTEQGRLVNEPKLVGLSRAFVYSRDGKEMSTIDVLREKRPDLTPDQYLDELAQWCKGDMELFETFLEEFTLYRNDTDSYSATEQSEPDGLPGEYWQTPQQSVERLGSSKHEGNKKMMLGDCDDLAFLSAEIIRRQGGTALVASIPQHAICIQVKQNSSGRYDVLTFGTEGLDVNGLKIERQSKESTIFIVTGEKPNPYAPNYDSRGYSTAVDAVNIALHKYRYGGLGLPQGVALTTGEKEGIVLLSIPEEGKRFQRNVPIEILANPGLQSKYLAAESAFHSRNYVDAAKLFSELEPHDKSGLITAARSNAEFLAGNLHQANELITKARQINSENPSILTTAAIQALVGGKQDEARTLFRLALSPDSKTRGIDAWDVVRDVEQILSLAGDKDGLKVKTEDLVLKVAKELIATGPREEKRYEFAESLANRWGRKQEIIPMRKAQVELYARDYSAVQGEQRDKSEAGVRYRDALITLAYREKEFGTPDSLAEVNLRIAKEFGDSYVVGKPQAELDLYR